MNNNLKIFLAVFLSFCVGVASSYQYNENLVKKIKSQNEVISFLIKANTDLLNKKNALEKELKR